jgi:ABC-type transport system involved in cytochrome c biogenesis permease subunit
MGESSLLWLRVAAGLYSLGLIDAIVTVLRRRESLFRVALGAFGLGAIFQLVSIVEQGLVQHHFPANDFFETMSLCAWLVTLVFLAIYWRYKAESLSVFVFPLVFVMTLVAALSNPVVGRSSEAVLSTWLTVHIVLALLGYAALLFTAIAAVAYLMQERQLKRKQTRSFYRLFPPLGMLDELISRSLGAGFVFITVSIIIIIVWAYISYGTSWIDDGAPAISTSFITWGIYLALIFFRVSAGWRGRKAAILAIVALCCSAVTWIAHLGLGSRLVQ